MSGVVILVPVITGAAWPVLVSAASAVLASLGYAAVAGVNQSVDEYNNLHVGETTGVEIELGNQEEIARTVGREEKLVFSNGVVTITFSRDVRGRFRVCVDGKGSKSELEAIGREIAGKVIQQYAYDRIVSEVRNRNGMALVDQSVDEDNSIRIKLRSWEE